MRRHIVTSLTILAALLLTSCLPQHIWQQTPDKPFDEDTIYTPQVPAANAPNTIFLAAGDDLQFRLQEAVITAQPGTTIVLPEGTFYFTDELVVRTSHITLAGRGMDKTVLNFSKQESGGQGIGAAANQFTVQDLAVEDTKGDGIRVGWANGVNIKRVRVEWTNGPDENNGAYGLYPVQCQNVLIEDSIIIGASDAGVYVGQSTNIIVRRNVAEFNVAGIEIENSTFADVYDNWASQNTGGILIFDLPNLEIYGGRNTRVFDNVVFDNHTPNFAPEGNIVGLVPAGLGIMVMANDEIEIFDNLIRNHGFASIAVVSYLIADIPLTDPNYDPFPEALHIHDNQLENSRRFYLNDNELSLLANLHFLGDTPEILYDGIAEDEKPGGISEDEKLCLSNNKTHYNHGKEPATYGIFYLASGKEFFGIPGGPVSRDIEPFTCQREALDPIVLDQPLPVPDPSHEYTPEEVAALCSAVTAEVNWNAFVVNCPSLDDYNLFSNSQDPTSEALGGGLEYDLTTPLFSDYAVKHRVVYMPPNTAATYTASGPFNFPEGTIIAKTFSTPDNTSLIETRLLIHRAEGWVGLPYIWNDGEATLALGGGSRQISWTDNGETLKTNYQIPNANQCTACHAQNGANQPIGPKAKWLNKTYTYSDGAHNQLTYWKDKLKLTGLPNDTSTVAKQPVWNDVNSGTLEARAKAYLDINCAHCHNPTGGASASALNLTAEQTIGTDYGICKPPVAAGQGAGNFAYDIVPGDPDNSILMYRLSSVEPAIKMPELGKNIVHSQGVELIDEWISSLSGDCE